MVVVQRLGDPPPTGPGILGWDELCGLDDDEPAEVLDGSTPWLLAFTSGSTGRPKGAVHTHGGISYGFMLDLGLPLDTRPGDRYFYPADMGWLAGPMGGVGPLTLGATVVLFDGVTDFPAAGPNLEADRGPSSDALGSGPDDGAPAGGERSRVGGALRAGLAADHGRGW